jgi:hypothetical protein
VNPANSASKIDFSRLLDRVRKADELLVTFSILSAGYILVACDHRPGL